VIYLLVFTLAFAIEVVWVASTQAVTEKRAGRSGVLAVIMVYLAAFTISEGIETFGTVTCWALGAGVGSWFTVRFGSWFNGQQRNGQIVEESRGFDVASRSLSGRS
jgi:hypothetical protein